MQRINLDFDQSRHSIQLGRCARVLRSVVVPLLVEGESAWANRAEGRVHVDGIPLVKVLLESPKVATLVWNHEHRLAGKLRDLGLERLFADANRHPNERIQWS